jgi:hypothetical protein
MRSTLAVVLLALAGSVPGGPPHVRAEPVRGHSAETQALTLYRESQELKQAGRLKAALSKVQEAYAILPTPTLLWPLADLHARNGEPVEALRALSRYRREMTPSEMEPGQQLADVDRLEAQLRTQLAHVRIAVPSKTQVQLDGQPVDGAARGERVAINPGSHRLLLVSEQGRSEKRFDIQPGEELSLPSATTGSAAGSDRYFPHVLTWGAIGLTGAALLSTAVVGGLAQSEAQSLGSRCPDRICTVSSPGELQTVNELISGQRTHATAASVLIGVSLALSAGTTALILLDWQRQKSGRTLLGGKKEPGAKGAGSGASTAARSGLLSLGAAWGGGL